MRGLLVFPLAAVLLSGCASAPDRDRNIRVGAGDRRRCRRANWLGVRRTGGHGDRCGDWRRFWRGDWLHGQGRSLYIRNKRGEPGRCPVETPASELKLALSATRPAVCPSPLWSLVT